MGITKYLYDAPFYLGGGNSSQVPSVYTVALNGHPYVVDFDQPFYRQYKREIAPLLRTQADVGSQPGEQSIDPNDLWRRSQEDWSLGAGQRYLDRKDSLPNRFWQSKGIDPWTKWQIGLLPDTASAAAFSDATQFVLTVNNTLYFTHGSVLGFTTSNLSTGSMSSTVVSGTPGTTITSIATDGHNVWFACGTAGIYTTTEGAASATQLVTTALDSTAIVAYLKGRLMVAWKNAIYNVTSTVPAALPAALFTQANTSFTWTGFGEGPTQIYMAGSGGGRSFIYGCTILTDGTALSPPIVQGETQAGETITAIVGYLGFLIVGTNRGVHFATVDQATGAVTLQALIPTPNAVKALNGFDRFVWFGWTNYDATTTGLGRMDLQNFAIQDQQPAYASDIMAAATQGTVTSIANFQGYNVFTVSTIGIFSQRTTYVASGTLDSGYILYDLPDTKIGILLAVQSPVPLPAGQYKAFVSADGGTFMAVGLHLPMNPDPVLFTVGQVPAQRFEVRMELDRDAVLTSTQVTISRYTLRSWPAPKRPLTWQVPIILNEALLNNSSSSDGFSSFAELTFLEGLCTSGQLANFQEGSSTYPVLVSDVTFFPNYTTEDRSFMNGMVLLQLKGIPS